MAGRTDKARLAALSAVAVALAATLWALSAGREAARKGKARAADAVALESELASGAAARAWLARAAEEGPPADLAEAARTVFGSGARAGERDRIALAEGWEKRVWEVESGEIALKKVPEFLALVREAGKGRWRLAEAVVDAADKPGRGSAKLVFSTLSPADTAW